MQKKIFLVLLMLLLSLSYPAKETGCGYFLNGTWYGYECCSDEECDRRSVCIDHECVRLQCAGDMNLNLKVEGGRIKAEVKGIENCEGKTLRIKDGSCEGQTVCSFVWNVTECYFEIPKPGEYEYFACLDMNGDGNYSSDEMDNEELVVTLYMPENQTVGGGSPAHGKNMSDDPLGIFIPIGLFGVILLLIIAPWLHETLEKIKKSKGKKARPGTHRKKEKV